MTQQLQLEKFFKNHQQKINGVSRRGNLIRNIILGGQDGLVNVLGVILGVAIASTDPKLTIIAGLAATFAESVSMGAVAYTSTKTAKEHYDGERKRELNEIRAIPEIERLEVELIYKKKGFSGKKLTEIVNHICANEDLWLDTMMAEELGLTESKEIHPFKDAIIVLIAAFGGSLIPLIPFFFVPLLYSIQTSILVSIIFATLVLFGSGIIKGNLTSQNPLRSGVELALIGTGSGLIGFLIGWILS